MKRQILKDIIMVAAIAAFLTLIISSGATAQDTTKSKPKKGTVVIKITTGDNGKKSVIDTTFTISGPESEKALGEYMKKYEETMKDLGDEMKNIEVNVNIPEMMDSLGRELDSLGSRTICIGAHGRAPRHFRNDFDNGFEYNFEAPEPPDMPGQYYYHGEGRPGGPPRIYRFGENEHERGTLNDLLGPIPLESVKQYRIIERKGGKRIIIDLDNKAMAPRVQKNVIVIQGDEDQENPKH